MSLRAVCDEQLSQFISNQEQGIELQQTGKRAIVTGGSRGIGKAIARALMAEGVRVVISAAMASRRKLQQRRKARRDARRAQRGLGLSARLSPLLERILILDDEQYTHL
jgi:NAD(P)-dependent dehydrogenase (short-subunit alcohol dehydrogenase family)